jgi:cytochrome c556
MIRVAAAVLAVIAVGVTAVRAQNADAIVLRKNTMKQFGGAMKAPGAMIKGEAPFDLATVQASLKTLEDTAVKSKTVFPDDTKTGETDTLPVAFEKKADLFARFDKLGADAKGAHGTITDEASFKAEWPKVASNCGGCHKEYRKPK